MPLGNVTPLGLSTVPVALQFAILPKNIFQPFGAVTPNPSLSPKDQSFVCWYYYTTIVKDNDSMTIVQVGPRYNEWFSRQRKSGTFSLTESVSGGDDDNH